MEEQINKAVKLTTVNSKLKTYVSTERQLKSLR
jgi:hypothetical protein